MMKKSIVVSIQPASFQAATFKGDLRSNLALIASLGYDGAELAIRDPARINLDDLEEMVHASRLDVPAIGTGQAWGEEGLSFTDPDPLIRQAAMERIRSHIPVAARFGALIIVGLIRGTVGKGIEPAQAQDWLMEALRTCCSAARPHGVRLAIEPINRYETTILNNTTQAMDLIEKVNEDNLGLLLDTFHMNIEEARIEESIRHCGANILHFHVADSNRLHPGSGHLDFRSILASLFATGYSGWVSGEFLPLPDAETAAKENINFLNRL